MNNSNTMPLPMQILQMGSNKMVSKPLYVAAKLKIADLLADGPLPVSELAEKTKTHAPTLYRILRALASVGVFSEVSQETFTLTPLAEVIQDKPGSVRAMILWFNDPAHDRAWENLLYSVQTGEPAFDKAHGKSVFEYFTSNRELSEIFNQAMSSNARNTHLSVVGAYDFSKFKKLLDVGGGHGRLIMQIAEKNPALKVGVYDLPHVVEGARKGFAEAKLADRCEALGGSFFEQVPAGFDAHIMSFILHDWSDQECVRLLRNCAQALPAGGTLLIVENVIEPGNEPALGKLLDIEMLVMTTGRERRYSEFASMLSEAGFELKTQIRTASPVSILEAKKR